MQGDDNSPHDYKEPENPSGGQIGDGEDDLSFKELFEQSMEGIREGRVIRGRVVDLDDSHVLVDIGYKSEGQIPTNEFIDSSGRLNVKVGDEVDVLLVRKEDKDGCIVLSRKRAAEERFWKRVKEAYREKGTIAGKIVSRVKGGFSVDIGLQAFLPISQVDRRPIGDPDSVIGMESDFRIIKFDRRRRNIVLSRRAVIEAERKKLREKTLESIEEGAVLEGAVTNIMRYGLFVDLGGIDGLVHVTDMAWGRVGDPSEKYRIGDRIKVKILKFDRERDRISLGIKQLSPDPWENAADRYPPGAKITGRITSFAKYGAFLETEEGLSGLIHLDELSWTRNVKHPSQVLNVGDIVEALVLDLDVEKRRISLSIKRLEPNPWEVIATKFPVGAIIQGKIKNITDFGMFIGIDEGIDGLVHVSDLSWSKTVRHPSELYEEGQEVQAVILEIDAERERFSLGIKQLTPDPWEEIARKYAVGTRISGRVTNVTDFGLFLELEPGVEGLVHVSELPKGEGESPLEGFQVGDMLDAKVIRVSREEKKIGLSARTPKENEFPYGPQTSSEHSREATSNLGELLRKEMLNRQRETENDAPEGESGDGAGETD
ncbi:MAG: 30S ribosomal protein S1 [Deltaproteobacteria bacterium]|nr:30S ribosomal protein S1 [Deltaproteobacteria bacterium]